MTDHSLRFRDSRHSNEIRLKVPLSGSMRVADWDGAAFGFSLADEVGVTYFAAESDKQKRKWIKNIRLILSALRKKNFKVASDGNNVQKSFVLCLKRLKNVDFAGVIRKGHLVDTAREFLQMDGVVPITRPEGKRSEIVSGLLTPREIELLGDLPAEDDDHKQHTEKEKEEEAVDGDEHGKGKEEHGKGKEELGQAVEQHHTKHDDDDESGLREKLHHVSFCFLFFFFLMALFFQGKEAVHHTVVAVGEHIHEAAHQAKVEADHLASKAKRFLKVFSHTSVEKRLDRLQGHLVEYPISYKPRISADIYAVNLFVCCFFFKKNFFFSGCSCRYFHIKKVLQEFSFGLESFRHSRQCQSVF